jgi:hypothetical protein
VLWWWGSGRLLPPFAQIEIKKGTDFVDIMLSNILCDLHFCQNQPLKSTDDKYIGILRNKIKHLRNLT